MPAWKRRFCAGLTGCFLSVTFRRACARRPRCRAPDNSARSDRRSAPAAPAPWRQPARRRQERIGGDHPVALRADQRHAGVDQLLLRVEHVERGALADAGFLAHAVQRDLGGVHLGLGRLDLRLGGFELAPGLHQRLLRLVARRVEVDAALLQRLLGLADLRVFGAALIDRNVELGEARRVEGFEIGYRRGRAVDFCALATALSVG